MPSPVGHSLIGLAVASAWLLPRARGMELARAAWRERRALVAAVALANLPDVDYLPGLLVGDLNRYHHLHTHTLGWVALASLAAWWIWRRCSAVPPRRLLVLASVLGLSHLGADLFSADGRPPYGIMALWPFSDAYLISPHTLFWRLRKETVPDMFQWHNVQAVFVEIAWCLPLVLAAAGWKCRTVEKTAPREGA